MAVKKLSDAPKQPEATEPESKPKKKKKKIIFIVPLVLILALAGFGYKTMTKKPAVAKGGPTTTVGGPITAESSLTVNLRDGHYLEFTVGIQTAPGKADKVLTTDQPIVLDILNGQAEVMTEAQLLEPSGPAKLKADIVQAMNQQWPGLVQAIYFEQFVMQ
jgi:flagellar FliL protein